MMKYRQRAPAGAKARLQEAATLRVGEATAAAQASRSAGASQSAKVPETLVSRLKTQLVRKAHRAAQGCRARAGEETRRARRVRRMRRARRGTASPGAPAAGGRGEQRPPRREARRAQDASRAWRRGAGLERGKARLAAEKRAARRRESAGSLGRDPGGARTEGPRARRLAGGGFSPDDADAHAAAALAAARERAEELENRVKALTAHPSSTGCSRPSASERNERRSRAGPRSRAFGSRGAGEPTRCVRRKRSRRGRRRQDTPRGDARAWEEVPSCASARRRRKEAGDEDARARGC